MYLYKHNYSSNIYYIPICEETKSIFITKYITKYCNKYIYNNSINILYASRTTYCINTSNMNYFIYIM